MPSPSSLSVPPISPQKLLQAGLAYYALVFGAGFVLGAIRVPFIVPRIGERWAELAEMPIMAVVIYLAAGFVVRRFGEIGSPGRALAAGVVALAFLMASELTLATVVQDRTLSEYIASRDRVSGGVYVALLLVFAVMPRLRLPMGVIAGRSTRRGARR